MDKRSPDQAVPKSRLLPLARAIDEGMNQCCAKRDCLPAFEYNAACDHYINLRHKLARSKPQTVVDALVMVTSLQAVVAALAGTELDDDGVELVPMTVDELKHGLEGLRGFLEKSGGVSAQMLGLTWNGARRQ